MDDTLMIEPPPALRMAGSALRVPRKTPLVFTAMIRSHSSSVVSSMRSALAMPALLTNTSSRPKRPSAVCTASSQSASLVTSRCTYTASPPASVMLRSTAWPSSSRRSPNTTLAPSATNSSVSSAPWPLAPPEINTTFPSSLPMIWLLQFSRICGAILPARTVPLALSAQSQE